MLGILNRWSGMKVFRRRTPALPSDVQKRADKEITAALKSITTDGSRFIVNDTVWYMDRNGVLADCVMNAAWFPLRHVPVHPPRCLWLGD